MSQPRQLLPGSTYLITRRVILRHMLLRPDHVMNEILLYLLAVEACRAGVEVHAVCAMSDHIHLVVTDVRAALPEFLHAFHRTVAFCTKVHREWNDIVWDKEPTSVVRLETPAAVVEKIAYVLANPVTAGLVRRAHEWPGVTVQVSQIGRGTLRAKRPRVYLDPKNPAWPEEASLALALPPCVEPDGAEAFRRQVTDQLSRLEATAHADMAKQPRPFLGAKQARQVDPEARATSKEPVIDRNPTFAVGLGQEDAADRAVQALRSFRASYRAALEQWRQRARDVVFPVGTWWMRVFHRANVGDVTVAASG